jgi:hypothetical protein
MQSVAAKSFIVTDDWVDIDNLELPLVIYFSPVPLRCLLG